MTTPGSTQTLTNQTGPLTRDCRGNGVNGLIGPGVSGPERSHDDRNCRGCGAITESR